MSIERPMKLVVFGANGATGQWLVQLAVERGHHVTAVMREGASASVPQGVDVVRGDPLDAAFVDMAVTGKDAVVTALGVRYRRGRNPFSSIVSPPTLLSQSAAHMLAAMKRHGVSRIESYRVCRRAHSERGWSPWDDPASTPRSCVSAQSGWSSTPPDHPSQWAAIRSIAEKLGCRVESLRRWVRQARSVMPGSVRG